MDGKFSRSIPKLAPLHFSTYYKLLRVFFKKLEQAKSRSNMMKQIFRNIKWTVTRTKRHTRFTWKLNAGKNHGRRRAQIIHY